MTGPEQYHRRKVNNKRVDFRRKVVVIQIKLVNNKQVIKSALLIADLGNS